MIESTNEEIGLTVYPAASSEDNPNIEENSVMTVAECQVETQKHIENVRKYIRFIIDKIDLRGVKHDASKLESPEVELFAEHTRQLASLSYGTEAYQASLQALKPALDHHYASNRHHPEHFTDGVNDMTVVPNILFPRCLLSSFCRRCSRSERTGSPSPVPEMHRSVHR